MKHGRIGNDNAPREATQIRTLISDLDRVVQFLNCDIATEEKHAGVFDRSDVTYPLLASTLAARRDNLKDTIAVFEQRLATIKAPLVEPIAA
jgi:septation ring formation regulator EzrA